MRVIAPVVAISLLAGCSVAVPPDNLRPAPSLDDAQVLLDAIIGAGLDRDWQRLCANASGTCETELEGAEQRAPTSAPSVAAAEVHQPQGDGEGWTSGGVLFVLCGVDGLGEPYESEVLVFDDGTRLLATAAVYWTGTKIALTNSGEGVDVGGEAGANQGRCP